MYQLISYETVTVGAETLAALVGVIVTFVSLIFCARG
jgi:hypothetical protein